jgi:hypothetical protein
MTEQKGNKLIYGYSEAVHELAEAYIKRDILKCDSSLISDLLNYADDSGKLGQNFTYDNVSNFYKYSGYYINELSAEEQAILQKYSITDVEDIDDLLMTEISAEEDCFPEADIELLEKIQQDYEERNSQEIFEWWAVTEWLAQNLIQLGEPVMVNDYGHWWGRTCTGQAITLDGIIQKIAEQYLL